MKDLIFALAKGLVEDPSAIVITEDEPKDDGTIVYHLRVAQADMGRVIGKQGRIAKALRVIVKAKASRFGKNVMVEIDETN